MLVRGVTSTCTDICCCPTKHKYQAASLSCSFFRVTWKVLILSSLMATAESSKLPSASVRRQELQSPLRHHFFTLALPTGSHGGASERAVAVCHGSTEAPGDKTARISASHYHTCGRAKKTHLYFALYVHPTVMLLPSSPITWLLSTDKPARRGQTLTAKRENFPIL